MDFKLHKTKLRAEIHRTLESTLGERPDHEVTRIARYIALSPGHRWRALVAIAAGEIFESNAQAVVMPEAIGVELAHSASLILDDLPSMDDARIRRGKACAHLVFSTWAVDMAPMYLLTLAYEFALNNPLATPERRVAAAISLSQAGQKMIAGQACDLVAGDTDNEEQLRQRYRLKSGELYAAAAEGGGLLCNAPLTDCKTLYEVGLNLGLAYQFLDDVADVTASRESVGKDTGQDKHKQTAVSMFGVGGASQHSKRFQEAALDLLAPFKTDADFLRQIVSEASWAAS